MATLGLDEAGLLEKLKPAAAIYFVMDPGDVERIARYPLTLFGSDGLPFDPRPHPRQWGTFPHILAKMVRESGLMTLEQAIHKMTGQAAQQYGLQDRGRIETGCHADLVLFDPDRIRTAPLSKIRYRSARASKAYGSTAARPGTAIRRYPPVQARYCAARPAPSEQRGRQGATTGICGQ